MGQVRHGSATMAIATLDRPSRSAAFLLALRGSRERFGAVDMPEANDLTIGIMELVAQAERQGSRGGLEEALEVAKAKGMKLGNPHELRARAPQGKAVRALRAATSANAVAAELTARDQDSESRKAGVGNVRRMPERV